MKKIRLLIAATVPETLATILAGQPRFLADHYEVELVTSPGDEVEEIKAREGIGVNVLSMKRGISPIKDFISICRMLALLYRLKPHVVHSYTPKAGLISMVAARLMRVPVRIHTFTGLVFPIHSGLKRKILIWVDRLICACATQVVPEGDGVRADLVRLSVTRDPCLKIGNGNIAGVDTSYFARGSAEVAVSAEKIRAEWKIDSGQFVFVFVGRLNRDKGVKELVEAFSRIESDGHLILVGAVDRTAPVDADTLRLIERHPRIHQLGFQKDIRGALACADTLILPSYREGFPNVVLQAGAMGLPVIATDVNGSNEVVENGFNGWLIQPRDVDSLRAAMVAAIQANRGELGRMGERARARIKERFEQEEYWKRLLEFYEHCLDAAGIGRGRTADPRTR